VPDISSDPHIAAELDQLRQFADFDTLPCAWGVPLGSGDIRSVAADFVVTETLSFEPSGSGEHLLLRVRKTGHNTRWVAKRLADVAAIPYRSVSYAGMKDRHAVTEQWFGLHLAGRADPDFAELPDGIEVTAMCRHHRKLRQGQLIANKFDITIRNCEIGNKDATEQRLRTLASSGVPNYFGPQRFGRDTGNLDLLVRKNALNQLNRETRSFALSALRGALFNGYLSLRVERGDWQSILTGEVAVSAGPRRPAETGVSHPDQVRHASGLLWGEGSLASTDVARELESTYFARFPALTALLESAGSKAARRVLSSALENMNWSWGEDADMDTLNVCFDLGPGSYATVALRELLTIRDYALERSLRDE
jgi:tRNA pseudouridine13 synthase